MVARALDQAGYIFHASMLDTAGHNAPHAEAADRVRREMFRNIGLADLLSPRTNGCTWAAGLVSKTPCRFNSMADRLERSSAFLKSTAVRDC